MVAIATSSIPFLSEKFIMSSTEPVNNNNYLKLRKILLEKDKLPPSNNLMTNHNSISSKKEE
jgi:hypothetical protein